MAEPAFELRSALTYATHDGSALQGDLHLPSSRGKVPALVAVHGGGWQQGARNAFQHWGSYLAARGHALFSISYRRGRAPRHFPKRFATCSPRSGTCRGAGGAGRPRPTIRR
jgi:acetyl esterase/lipase